VKIQVLMEMEKKSCNKNVSEDDAGSKEDKSDAIQEELKDHDKLYFISPSEELHTYIATTNKNNWTARDFYKQVSLDKATPTSCSSTCSTVLHQNLP